MSSDHTLSTLIGAARKDFSQVFGGEAQWVVAAPGRVNLIGEHTDYNDGFVLPMAIDRYTVIAAGLGTGGEPIVDVVSRTAQDRQRIHVGSPDSRQLPKWCNYLTGVFELAAARGLATGPLNAVVHSSVPLGGGLSSSAALEVATATLVEAVAGRSLGGREKARLCQKVEHDYVGMPCGIMDQFSSALCREGEAMMLDCRSLETTPVPLDDPTVAVLVVNSQVKHELTGSEYPDRRRQCERAAAALGVPSLRDATAEMLVAKSSALSPVEFRRARHVIGEIARVGDFAAAASRRDWTTAGRLMYASHDSLRDDYEVSCPEIDRLVEIAKELGDAAGVFGSRITGGGFGGCTVTLCQSNRAESLAERILGAYRQSTGVDGNCFVTAAARGCHVVGE